MDQLKRRKPTPLNEQRRGAQEQEQNEQEQAETWAAQKEFVLTVTEGKRVTEGLKVMAVIDATAVGKRPEAPEEAEQFLDKLKELLPDESTPDLIERAIKMLRREAQKAATKLQEAGIDIPSEAQIKEIADYLVAEQDAFKLVEGLRILELGKETIQNTEKKPRSKEVLRAMNYLARFAPEDRTDLRGLRTQVLQELGQRRAALKQKGINVAAA